MHVNDHYKLTHSLKKRVIIFWDRHELVRNDLNRRVSRDRQINSRNVSIHLFNYLLIYIFAILDN